jgi:predicted O-methyltransferase YrrM
MPNTTIGKSGANKTLDSKEMLDKLMREVPPELPRPMVNISWTVFQKKTELNMLQDFLKNEKIRTVLEIGTSYGGSALLWAKMVNRFGGHVYCVDLFDYDTQRQYHNTPYETTITEIKGDSHSPDTVRRVISMIPNNSVDLLFIDGDHTYSGSKADYDNYAPLVRPGGFIAFHDIRESESQKAQGCHVYKLWGDIKKKFPYNEFIDPKAYEYAPAESMGIGIIKIPKLLADTKCSVMDTSVSKDEGYSGVFPDKYERLNTEKPLTKFLTKYFLITSHTEGKYAEIKQKLLIDLVTSLKTFFPNSYVMVASASDVPDKVFVEADYVQIDRTTKNIPYGNGELELVKNGLDWLKSKGAENVYKFSYDFIINEKNKSCIEEWSSLAGSLQKKFVGTAWVDKIGSPYDFPPNHSIIGTWLYYGNIDFLQTVFNKLELTDYLEHSMTRVLKSESMIDKIYVFRSADSMLGFTWEQCGDLVRDGGNTLKPEVFGTQIPEPVVTVIPNKKTVLCSLCTKDRYDTTLALAIESVVLQTKVPDKLIIYDDGEHKNLNTVGHYEYLFKTLYRKGCNVWMDWGGQGRGQHLNDSRANHEGFTYVIRLDDDEVMEHDVIERLVKILDADDTIGAVGCAVVDPNCTEGTATGKVENIFSEPSFQWFTGKTTHKAFLEHLHGAYMYRANVAEWDNNLSPVSHRGETMFSMELRRKGYKLFADQGIVIWHYRSAGGIRTNQENRDFLFDHDEKIFLKYLESWGYKLCVLDNGIGDHIVFRTEILPELQKRYPHIILSVCYEDVFTGHLRDGDSMISIGHAPMPARVRDSIFDGLDTGRLTGTLRDAFRQHYLGEGR